MQIIRRTSVLGALALLVSAGTCLAATEDPSTVLVLVNDLAPPEPGTNGIGASVYVGEYYAQRRGIPAANILHLSIPIGSPAAPRSFDGEVVPWPVFHNNIRQPIKAFLQNNGLINKIKYIVPTYGVPVSLLYSAHIFTPPLPESFPTSGFSIDSFLATLWSGSDDLFVTNPFAVSDPSYMRVHFRSWSNPAGWPMYLVTRLDGPGPLAAAALVDKAIQAESGLTKNSGIGYFDWRHNDNSNTDKTMKRAYDLSVTKGFSSVLNDQTVSGGLIQNAPNTLWAWGWYSGASDCDCYQFAPGAVGAQLTSYTANRVRVPGVGNWVHRWLLAGITATWGATSEPYTSGYADGDNLLNHFWNGYNFGESAYLSSPSLNWMMVFVGDPLYSPRLFNTSFRARVTPKMTVSGTKTGQFYTGDLTMSIALPPSPAVAGVQFQVEGYDVGPEVTAGPWAVTFQTDHTWNAPLTLTARVRYTNGQVVVSDPVAVIFNNPAP